MDRSFPPAHGGASRFALYFAHALRHLLVLGGLAFLCLAGLRSHATQVVPVAVDETVRQSESIVVGTVGASRTRWGDATRRWMITDYDLRIEEVLFGGGASLAAGTTTTVSYWGGTIGEERQAVADLRLPAAGERVVLMLRSGWATQFAFTPTVGFDQGFYSIAGGLAQDSTGTALARDDGGRIVRRAPGVAVGDANVGGDEFLAWLRANVGAIRAAPSQPQQVAPANDARILQTFAKAPSLLGSRAGDPTAAHTEPVPGLGDALAAIPAVSTDKSVRVLATEAIRGAGRAKNGGRGKYTWQGPASPPIVVNSFPTTFAPWYPEDQYQMSKWNYYASDTFRVYVTPSGTYGWPNGIFDLAGWPSSADLAYVYGSGWAANTIGITFLRYNGTIAEADIALNPAFAFTLDDEWVYDGTSVQGFRQVMAHELGHMHGLLHEFNDMSLMNYMPSNFRAFGIPYGDDAEAIRSEYPARAVAMTDLAVYMYRPTGFQSITDASYPFAVTAGQPISVTDYFVENAGTATIAVPTIEWYLTTARNYNNAYYFLGTRTYSSLSRFTHFTPSTVGVTLTVPPSVPTGNYYVGAFIRGDAGVGQTGFPYSNNFAFTRGTIFVQGIANPTFNLSVTKSGNGTGVITSSPSGINCGSTCTAAFNSGASVALTPTASLGTAFTGWSGACTGTGPCVVTMDAAKSVNAMFVLATDNFPVNCVMPAGWVKPPGAQAGWSISYDQNYEGTCAIKSDPISHGERAQVGFTALFAAGEVVLRRRVSSEPGFDFFRFYIDGVEQGPHCDLGSLACSGASATGATASGSAENLVTAYNQPVVVLHYPVTAGVHTFTFSYEKDGSISSGADAAWLDGMSAPVISVTAALTVSKAGAGTGLVTTSPAGINCGVTCTANFGSGATVTLNATADAGSAFAGWSGSGCSGTGSCQVTMDAAKSVTATFVPVAGLFPANCALPEGWVTAPGANAGWSAAFDQVFEGTCSLKSMPIGNGQKAQVQFAGKFRAGSITFRRRVSSEPGFDFFRFYIDGVEQGATCALGNSTCSGATATGPTATGAPGTNLTDWTQPAAIVSVPVTAGNHTITFSYEKDGSISMGSDAAWIDLVTLPLGNGGKRVDFNADGMADLPWKHNDGRHALWSMNGLAPTGTQEILGAGTGWNVVQIADFNGDGKSDLVWQHPDGRAAIWLMNGLVPLATQQILNAGLWTIVQAPDLNGDGKADLVFQHADGSVAVWTMNGTVMTGGTGVLGAGTGWSVIKTGDFDGDGKDDLLWRHTDGRHAIWMMNGTAVAASAQILNAGAWTAIQVADMNGDGKADIVWRNADGTLAAWLMNGPAMASGAGLLGAGTGWTIAGIGDFNGDGKADLHFEHPDGRAAIWLMNGLSPTSQAQVLNAGGGWSARRVADLNGDGKSDIVWGNTDGRVAVWLMNGTAMSSGSGILGAGTGWSVLGVSP